MKEKRTSNAVNLKRFKVLVESYGAEPSRWPAGERDAAVAFLEKNSAAREIFARATRLDSLLATVDDPKAANKAFIKRLETIPFGAAAAGAAELPTTFGEFIRRFFPARRFVPQSIGLIAVCALGFWMGLSFLEKGPTRIVEIDPANYLFQSPDLDQDIQDLR